MSLTPLPTPPNRAQSPTAFAAAADALLGALPQLVTEINATEVNISNKEISVTNSVSAAAASAASASAAPSTASTSTTSVSIGVGTKNFAIAAGKNIVPGMFVTAAYDANNYMFGSVISYAGTALSINVIGVVGGGTYASWSIALSAPVTPLNNFINGTFTVNGNIVLAGAFGLSINSQFITALNAGQFTFAGSASGLCRLNLVDSGSVFLGGLFSDGTSIGLLNKMGVVPLSIDAAGKTTLTGDLVIVGARSVSVNSQNISAANPGQFTFAGSTSGLCRLNLVDSGSVFLGGLFSDGTSIGLLNKTGAVPLVIDAAAKATFSGAVVINNVQHDVATVDGVGSLRLLRNASAGSIATGGTTAGSTLNATYFTSGSVLTNGSAVSGTWKNISSRTVATGEFSEWLRIA